MRKNKVSEIVFSKLGLDPLWGNFNLKSVRDTKMVQVVLGRECLGFSCDRKGPVLD